MSDSDKNLLTMFQFSQENLLKARDDISKYPPDKKASAILPLLHLVQEQIGWISAGAIEYLSHMLEMPKAKIFEIASFYTMFLLQPKGMYKVNVCQTTPCWLRGSDDILARCKEVLGVNVGDTTPDKLFTLNTTECLGACTNAPLVQINNEYHENLTADQIEQILHNLSVQSSDTDLIQDCAITTYNKQ